MKYKAEVVAYESYGEVYLGDFEVEADNEEEADMAARCRNHLNGSVNSMTLPVCFHTAGMSARYAGTGQIGNRTPVRFATHC